jgi:hypothetical protein
LGEAMARVVGPLLARGELAQPGKQASV